MRVHYRRLKRTKLRQSEAPAPPSNSPCWRSSLLAVFVFAALAAAEVTYQKPPRAVQEILDAPATPVLSVSPAHTHVILAEPLRYPPIADLAEPMLRLAGIRINPKTNGPHRF